jgi:hypothetical protein
MMGEKNTHNKEEEEKKEKLDSAAKPTPQITGGGERGVR